MSSTNQTTNYELPLFIGTDKPTWLGDFNGAMNKIDTAIKGVSDVASGNTSSIGSVESDVDSLETQVGTLENTVASHTSDIASQGQSITALTTTTNQLNTRVSANTSHIGDVTELETDVKTDVVSAINELNSDLTEFSFDEISGSFTSTTNKTTYFTIPYTVPTGYEICSAIFENNNVSVGSLVYGGIFSNNIYVNVTGTDYAGNGTFKLRLTMRKTS